MIALLLLLLLFPQQISEPPYTERQLVRQVEAKEIEMAEEDIVETEIAPEIEVKEKKCKSYTQKGCSCVAWVVSKGFDFKGNAEDAMPLINWHGIPTTGSIAVFYYKSKNTYHMAYVEIVYPSGNFRVSECNFKEGECGERDVMLDDVNLLGFIYRLIE